MWNNPPGARESSSTRGHIENCEGIIPEVYRPIMMIHLRIKRKTMQGLAKRKGQTFTWQKVRFTQGAYVAGAMGKLRAGGFLLAGTPPDVNEC